MTSWFYVNADSLDSNPVSLDKDHVRHVKALRMKQGDFLVLSDGRGRAIYGRLEYLQKDSASVRLYSDVETCSEPAIGVRLFLGITKSDKMDAVVRQSVELGCSHVIPVITERTVVSASPSRWEKKAERWRSIALSAAAQSRRRVIPQVINPLEFQDIFPLLEGEGLTVVPWEEERTRSLGSLLRQFKHPPPSLSIFTGPEGGISSDEVEKLLTLPSVHPVTLGPRILRAETAPIAVLSIVMGYWGDMS